MRIRGNYFGGGAAIQRHPSILGSLAAPPKFSPELVQVGLLAGYSRTSSVFNPDFGFCNNTRNPAKNGLQHREMCPLGGFPLRNSSPGFTYFLLYRFVGKSKKKDLQRCSSEQWPFLVIMRARARPLSLRTVFKSF